MFGSSLIRRPQADPFASFVDHFFDRSFFRPSDSELSTRSWIPSVDLSQNDDFYTVVADLPGLQKDDLEITVENETLTIAGERKFESEENKENYTRIERSYGTFSRSFSLPSNVDAEKVDAKFADGVLTVKIPKLEKAKSRKISVK